MPSSPEECTATPSWNVSQTEAAFTHERMKPQNVVSRRITSTAVSRDVRRQLLEVHDDGVRRERHGVPSLREHAACR